jgi:hypothetical protein
MCHKDTRIGFKRSFLNNSFKNSKQKTILGLKISVHNHNCHTEEGGVEVGKMLKKVSRIF